MKRGDFVVEVATGRKAVVEQVWEDENAVEVVWSDTGGMEEATLTNFEVPN